MVRCVHVIANAKHMLPHPKHYWHTTDKIPDALIRATSLWTSFPSPAHPNYSCNYICITMLLLRGYNWTQYNATQYDGIHCATIRYNWTQYNATQYDGIHCTTKRYNWTQYNTSHSQLHLRNRSQLTPCITLFPLPCYFLCVLWCPNQFNVSLLTTLAIKWPIGKSNM